MHDRKKGTVIIMKKTISAILATLTAASSLAAASSAFPVWRGDANGDGRIDLKDAAILMKHSTGWDVSVADSADFDGDGEINTGDVMYVMRYLTGWHNEPDELLEAKYGVSETSFGIPDPVTDKTVDGARFGFDTSAADNSGAFIAAVAYLKENPGTKLQIEKGTYKMNPSSTVSFSGVKDCTVDCGGSTFLYSAKRYFTFTNCENVKMCNMTVDWDHSTYQVSSMVRVKSVTKLDDGNYDVAYEFFLTDDASYALDERWDSLIHYDPDDLTPTYPSGDLFNVEDNSFNRRLTEPNVITLTCNAGITPTKIGETLLIRHANYDSTVFVLNGGSHGMVFENITIYSVPGCGFSVADLTHHVRVTGLTVGLNPANSDYIRMSTTADVIHMKDSLGYLILEDSDISFNGDDALNIHDNVAVVEDCYDGSLYFHTTNTTAFRKGDTISFKNNDYSDTGISAVIESVSHSGMSYTAVLDTDLEGEVEAGMIVVDDTVDSSHCIVRNSYFHENRARALLIGSSDALVENCRFYHVQQSAINIPVDITTDLWDEGRGAENIIIRNNTFEQCNNLNINGGAQISIVASNGFSKDGSIQGYCFNNVLICGNKFIDPPGYIFQLQCSKNLAFVNNTIEYTKDLGDYMKSTSAQIKILGVSYDGCRIINNRWAASEYMPQAAAIITFRSSKNATLYCEGNRVS